MRPLNYSNSKRNLNSANVHRIILEFLLFLYIWIPFMLSRACIIFGFALGPGFPALPIQISNISTSVSAQISPFPFLRKYLHFRFCARTRTQKESRYLQNKCYFYERNRNRKFCKSNPGQYLNSEQK